MIIRYSMILCSLLLLGVASVQLRGNGSVPLVAGIEDQTEPHCGPAALYVICKAEDISITLDELKQQARLSRRGTNLMGLKAAALNLGLKAVGTQSTLEELHHTLQHSEGRAILHLPRRQHFVAVLSSTTEALCVVDPTQGCAYWDADRLSQEGWKGHALLITK
jgi:ABC-type bacteriocin/lantibiotic exporter with double-glycine peptidase domain